MARPRKREPKQEPKPMESEESFSELSSEDEDAALLTSKVEEKLLSTLAKIKMKHPSIYQTKQDLYEQSDFSDEENEEAPKPKPEKATKFTYRDLVKEVEEDNQDEDNNLPPVFEERKAKQKFKKALTQNIDKMQQDEEELFQVKSKVVPKEKSKSKDNQEDDSAKFQDLTKTFKKDTKKIIKKAWNSQQLDETDLFLKNYILNKKWLTSKIKQEQNQNQEKIDEEDEERSQEMDEYEAQYNFRFEEPGGTEIKQYPRQVQNSLRQKVESRREQRKKKEEKKKQEEEEIRLQAEKRKEELKKEILEKIVPEQEEKQGQEEQEEEDHDWFFCDDCCKGFTEGEEMWECTECQDYMLCSECNEIIIHKHPLTQGIVPIGYGAPVSGQDRIKELQSCIQCRRKITPNHKRYKYTDRNYIVNSLCEICFDQSNLQTKKKYKEVEAKQINYEQIFDQNPVKIKELTNSKEIEEMIDEYLKYDYEDVLSGGLKTKFKYIDVKPQSYGLSDEQILFGADKELNKYISIKQLAPYREGDLRLRNSIFNQKIRGIKKSVKSNKNLLEKGEAKIARMRYLTKRRNRVQRVKKRLEKRMRLVNLSNQENERNYFVPNSRLLSYGLSNEQQE